MDSLWNAYVTWQENTEKTVPSLAEVGALQSYSWCKTTDNANGDVPLTVAIAWYL